MSPERNNPGYFSREGQMAEARLKMRGYTGRIILGSALVYALGSHMLNKLPDDAKDTNLISDANALKLEEKDHEIQLLRAQIEQLRLSAGQVDSGLVSCQCDGPSEMEIVYKCDMAPTYSYATVNDRK